MIHLSLPRPPIRHVRRIVTERIYGACHQFFREREREKKRKTERKEREQKKQKKREETREMQKKGNEGGVETHGTVSCSKLLCEIMSEFEVPGNACISKLRPHALCFLQCLRSIRWNLQFGFSMVADKESLNLSREEEQYF